VPKGAASYGFHGKGGGKPQKRPKKKKGKRSK
jgi:hypothetical protein